MLARFSKVRSYLLPSPRLLPPPGLLPLFPHRKKSSRELTAFHATGMHELLEHDAASSLSIARGLALCHWPGLLSNWYQYSTYLSQLGEGDNVGALRTPTTNLLLELFYMVSSDCPIRTTANRSIPAAHLSPQLLGHIYGLSLVQSSSTFCEAEVVERLQCLGFAELAKETGVSIARFARLVKLIRECRQDQSIVFSGVPDHTSAIVLAFLWMKVLSLETEPLIHTVFKIASCCLFRLTIGLLCAISMLLFGFIQKLTRQ